MQIYNLWYCLPVFFQDFVPRRGEGDSVGECVVQGRGGDIMNPLVGGEDYYIKRWGKANPNMGGGKSSVAVLIFVWYKYNALY